MWADCQETGISSVPKFQAKLTLRHANVFNLRVFRPRKPNKGALPWTQISSISRRQFLEALRLLRSTCLLLESVDEKVYWPRASSTAESKTKTKQD